MPRDPGRDDPGRNDPGRDDPGGSPRAVAVSGYRLVRKLGDGDRCEVHLAIPDAAVDGIPEPVALKLARPGVSASSVLVEADALSRCSHPHLMHLVDVAHHAGSGPAERYLQPITPSPCLVVERLPRGSLATLLRSRDTLKAGEAVTIIGPIIEGVAALHAGGVVHGRIAANAVFFRESGAPVLCRFGAAKLIPPGLPPAVLDDHPGVLADRRDVLRLLSVVLERVEGPVAGDVLDDAVRLVSGTGECDARSMASIAERLFALAPAEAIDFTPLLAELDAVRHGSAGADRAARVPARLRGRATLNVPGEAPSAVTAVLAARLRTLIGSARPRLWLTAGGVAIAVVAALLAIPSGGPDGADGADGNDATRQGAEPAPAQAKQSRSRSTSTSTLSAAQPGASPAVRGDDPVSAVVALISARQDCLAQLSDQCFSAIDQAGSAALLSDLDLVRGVRGGDELPAWQPVTAASVTLVQRLGDSALLSLHGSAADSKPASILVMRTEAGWRIRDYLEE